MGFWGRLVEAGGSVLRLGADTNTVTLIHYAEYLAHVPDKRRVRRHRRVFGSDGPGIRVVECLDDNLGIVDGPARTTSRSSSPTTTPRTR